MTRHIGEVLAVFFIAVLGVGNFALHKAVIERRKEIFRDMPPLLRRMGGRASLAAEFILLVGAMLLVAHGQEGWGVAYLAYTALNAGAAWLIINHHI